MIPLNGPATETGGAPVVAPERGVEQDFDRRVLLRRLPPHKVVVHNNDYNTFEEVIQILMKAVSGMSLPRAQALANEIHTTGAAVPYIGPKERAEAVAAVIRTIGIKVTVEPDE
ncbi:MAG: ATP-dependent Clp protease adaptor ClpS [Chloroflexi bacterium]|nr:ATP-dependent Clp protease adaptor ClpS [Chloroflexota bacterium]